jgi:hypothetical protein
MKNLRISTQLLFRSPDNPPLESGKYLIIYHEHGVYTFGYMPYDATRNLWNAYEGSTDLFSNEMMPYAWATVPKEFLKRLHRAEKNSEK